MNNLIDQLEYDLAKTNKKVEKLTTKITNLKLLQKEIPDVKFKYTRLTSSKIIDLDPRIQITKTYYSHSLNIIKSFSYNKSRFNVYQDGFEYGIEFIKESNSYYTRKYFIIDIEKDIKKQFSNELYLKIMNAYTKHLIKVFAIDKTLILDEKSFVPQKVKLLMNFS